MFYCRFCFSQESRETFLSPDTNQPLKQAAIAIISHGPTSAQQGRVVCHRELLGSAWSSLAADACVFDADIYQPFLPPPAAASPGPAACLLSGDSKSPHTAQHYSTRRSAIQHASTLITAETRKFCIFDFASGKDIISCQLGQKRRVKIRIAASLKWIFAKFSLKMCWVKQHILFPSSKQNKASAIQQIDSDLLHQSLKKMSHRHIEKELFFF